MPPATGRQGATASRRHGRSRRARTASRARRPAGGCRSRDPSGGPRGAGGCSIARPRLALALTLKGRFRGVRRRELGPCPAVSRWRGRRARRPCRRRGSWPRTPRTGSAGRRSTDLAGGRPPRAPGAVRPAPRTPQVDPGEAGVEPGAPPVHQMTLAVLQDAAVLQQRQPVPHPDDAGDTLDPGGGDVPAR